MTFVWPWMLLSLLPVLATAAWVLLRPRRLHVSVGSIRLWSEAMASLSATGRPRRNQIVLSWLLILIGSLLAVGGLARPQWHATESLRRIALVISPTAEFAGDSGEELFSTIDFFLDRLGRHDQVHLVLPTAVNGTSNWLEPGQAKTVVRQVGLLPARFDEMTFPPDRDADQTVAIIPAVRRQLSFQADGVIDVPTSLPAVTIYRLNVYARTDGRAHAFSTLLNNTAETQAVELVWVVDGVAGPPERLLIPANESKGATHTARARQSVMLMITKPFGLADLMRAMAVYREGERIRVAMVGQDSPAVRRYIDADDRVDLSADRSTADVVIAVGATVRPDEAAIMINPPVEAYPRRSERSDVVFSEVALSDSDLLAGVSFPGVGVGRISLLEAEGVMALAALAGEPILLADPGGSARRVSRRRVIVPFDINPVNTNWTLTPSFAIFMANAVRWTTERPDAHGWFETVSPAELGSQLLLEPVELANGQTSWGGSLIRPGMYRTDANALVAVSLMGLRGGRPVGSPQEQVNAVRLCEPSFGDVGRELWAFLVASSLACWLTGWLVAAKKD